MGKILYTWILFVAFSLFTLPCFANCNIDNSPIFGLSCASPDSVTKSQLDFYNTDVKHGYFDSVNSNNKLSYDDVLKLADMERFPHEMLTKKNIRFKTKKSMWQIMGNAIIMYYNSNIFLEYILMGKCTSYIVRQKVNTLSLENMFRI